MKTRHDKLVRDRIPELLAQRGIPHEVRVVEAEDMHALLNAKLEEEFAEYMAATDDEARIGELADLLEVILSLGGLHGADSASLERVRAQKAADRGTFEARLVLMSTGTDD